MDVRIDFANLMSGKMQSPIILKNHTAGFAVARTHQVPDYLKSTVLTFEPQSAISIFELFGLECPIILICYARNLSDAIHKHPEPL